MNEFEKINRRKFFKKGLTTGAAIFGSFYVGITDKLFAKKSSSSIPDLVAVRNGEPDVMFDRAIASMGGMSKFVKKGQTVVVKPNIAWNREIETGADTNPLLVKRIVEHCVNAGAKKVYVFDHTCDTNWRKCYKNSGIEDAAKAAGAIVVPGNNEKYYEEVRIPGANILKTTKVHELILETDVFINVPVLKHHSSTRLTIAMKNLMGVMWDRGWYHSNGLHECIADFCLYRKPDLNIVDAYRVTMDNGPSRARKEDVILKKSLLISRDIVAVDAAAAKIFGLEPGKVKHIRLGYDKNIGNINLEELNIKKIVL